jgi:hypothetical protein
VPQLGLVRQRGFAQRVVVLDRDDRLIDADSVAAKLADEELLSLHDSLSLRRHTEPVVVRTPR